jgi:hypothetical protein
VSVAITNHDRARWQRQAARELMVILEAGAGLPVIAWTVNPAGGGLAGRINGLAPAAAVRATFAAWHQALALDDVAETSAAGGAVAYLRARAWRSGVRVTLLATVFHADGDGHADAAAAV